MKKWRLDFRIWHWIHATVILGLLGTIFLRETFLNVKVNNEILLQKLSGLNIEITKEQVKVLGKAIYAPMWEWHIFLGYALSALLLWRIVLFFTKSGKENYQNLKLASIHKKMVKLSYIGIYTVLSIMAITGLMLHFHELLGLSKSVIHNSKEIHELFYNIVLIFVPLHIVGIIIAENRDEKGIISDMIHGGKSHS